jgi:glycosyltransferase involved in cell wall biosynthesis
MYPGRTDPDFGIFVAQLERQLVAQGHELARAVIDRRGGSRTKYARLGADAAREAWRFQPDVVYAHFLVPAGALAALASLLADAPLVVTAHGRDVRNIGRIPGVREATRLVLRRAATVVCVSDYLRRELERALPEAASKTAVVDCGVDLDRFRGRDGGEARRRVGWDGGGPFFLFVGTLDERKNVLRLAEAFTRLGTGQLALVGDGPLRARLEALQHGVRSRLLHPDAQHGVRSHPLHPAAPVQRAGAGPVVRIVGRVPHPRVADWIAACDVLVQPSLVEPFGQALLEAMASERSVVATRVGGPPEFVTPRSGVLVDPTSVDSIERGLREALALPRPNLQARQAAARHDVRVQARRVSRILAEASSR